MHESAVYSSDWMDVHLEMDRFVSYDESASSLAVQAPSGPSPGVWRRLPGAECLGPRQVQARLPRPVAEEKRLDFVFLKDFKILCVFKGF